MKNHCDIYKVTLRIKYSEIETGGLHEQEIDKGVFQGDICALSEGIKKIKARNFRRVLFQYGVQPQICYPEIKWSCAGEAREYTPAAQETYLWLRGFIDLGICMGGSGISLFSKAKSLNKTMDAMDTEQVPSKSADREAVAVDQRKADRPQTQKQKGTNRQTHLRPNQTRDSVETSHSNKDRQLGYKDAGMDRSGHRVTFWEQCRGEVCVYHKSNGHSYNLGREPGRVGQGRRCHGRRS
jgi:hypothetical protein